MVPISPVELSAWLCDSFFLSAESISKSLGCKDSPGPSASYNSQRRNPANGEAAQHPEMAIRTPRSLNTSQAVMMVVEVIANQVFKISAN